MKKTTGKEQTPKLQLVSKMNRAALETQPLLTTNPQAPLPLPARIGQAQLSIEDVLGRTSRQFIEQMLLMAAESAAGAKHPVSRLTSTQTPRYRRSGIEMPILNCATLEAGSCRERIHKENRRWPYPLSSIAEPPQRRPPCCFARQLWLLPSEPTRLCASASGPVT